MGNKCGKCGIDDFRVLQVDHIDGNGYAERKQFKLSGNGTVKYYRHILEVNGEGYQLLCANCNWIKRYEQAEQNQFRG
uniref:HNH endonuclease n=1 Tax=viral metagenome TaxID=1070528 RepID=A0A6M3IQ70_9ZZZZ